MSLVSSTSAAQDWTSCWIDHYQTEEDFETLRWTNEEYVAKTLDYETTDLSRIRRICNSHVLARPIGQGKGDRKSPRLDDDTKDGKSQDIENVASEESRICLCTDYVMGLVPPTATVDDVIVRFWNCNAAIVMRPADPQSKSTSFMLVGRADVAEVVDQTVGTFPQNHLAPTEAVYVDLDLRTLQKITAHITTRS